MAKNSPAGKPGQAASDAADAAPESFELALAELEELVRRMEEGELTLEGSLAAYRRGALLVTYCRQSLTAVQQQIRVLEGDLLRPFDAEGSAPAAG